MKKVFSFILWFVPFICFSQLYVKPINGEQVVVHKGFLLSYNEDCEQASFVSYFLTKERLNNPVVVRKDRFIEDPYILTGSAHPNDYLRSGYDRGHLCPAADMLWDSIAMIESFYMSNMSPQVPGFNRGIWKSLETYVRVVGQENDTTYIITGPILSNIEKRIGNNNVCIPNSYYKIISIKKNNNYHITCFLLPNQKSNNDIFDYLISLEELEKISGLIFLIK